jgi:hypothetical protein
LEGEQILDIELMVRVNVDQFYGIEIEEFPARIAQTALWLMDHLMNNQASAAFGKYIVRIPLTTSATIINDNSLTIDWGSVVAKDELSYILGNPPFLGSRMMDKTQKSEVEMVFNKMKNFGDLDYVTCWYKKTAVYIQGTQIECAFVSTNSICQGLHVSILWPELINKYGIKINFAHQTFKWSNKARGNAAIYCIIVGFSLYDRKEKYLYHYSSITSEPEKTTASKINAYLVEGENVFIKTLTNSICSVPGMKFGSMPADGGFLLFTTEEKNAFLEKEPSALQWIRRIVGSQEYINGIERWCLWLVDIEPSKLRKLKFVLERIEKVKEVREKSARPNLAKIPHLFAQIAQPTSGDYIIVPSISSERRRYIPIGFMPSSVIANNKCFIIPQATLYHFSILTSTMHMAWTRYVSGRLKSDYQYSKDIVYNNFPWPNSTEKQIHEIESLGQKVLDIRSDFPKSNLASLYDPLTMPLALVKAHQKLDKTVENAYGRKFDDDSQRVAYLFELYQTLTGELFKDEKKRGKGKKI